MIVPKIGIRNAFYGEPDVRYVLDDYNRFPTLDEVFLEYVRFATARKKNGVENLYVKDLDYGSVGYDNPAFTLIDGVPINDLNYIWEFDQAEVENIEIVSRMYNQGSKEFFGVINLTTFKGNLGGNTVPDYLIQRLYKGIQQPREFYSPAYDVPNLEHRLPDYRSLLTWQPELMRDEDGNFRTRFYTSDQAGKFMVEVMGISKSGVVVSDRKLVDVKLSKTKP